VSFLWWCDLSQKPTTVTALGDCSVHIPLQTACNQWSHSHMGHRRNIFRLTGQTQGLLWHEVDTNDRYHCESVDLPSQQCSLYDIKNGNGCEW
jgi:hypothetical protein